MITKTEVKRAPSQPVLASEGNQAIAFWRSIVASLKELASETALARRPDTSTIGRDSDDTRVTVTPRRVSRPTETID